MFCLTRAPNKEACNEVHKNSHGNTACNIIEVSDDEYNLFLGEGNNVNDLAYTNSGEIDTGYRIDLLVESKVIIELKAVEKLLAIHEAQLLTYLKLSNKKVGLLINFNSLRLKHGIKRIIN